MTDTLCILGCGNLGTAILKSLLDNAANTSNTVLFTQFIACVRTEASKTRLASQFHHHSERVLITTDNIKAIQDSNVIILGVDPSQVEFTLTQPGLYNALKNKLLISVVAGWTRAKIEAVLYGTPILRENVAEGRAWVVRTLPNIAALVSQSLTAIEISEPHIPDPYLEITDKIFNQIGRTVHIPASLMDATTAVAGSTPAMFAVIVDAMIDAAVAVGVPRGMAQSMIYQAMQGTASLLQSGIHPALLKDQGTAPEGCTIGGLMVMEEGAVRGHVGKALREAVTVARLMDGSRHVNDTRQ